MQQSTNAEFYRLALYLLGGLAGLFISLICWIVKNFRKNQNYFFKITGQNATEIEVVKKDLENLRHEHDRNHPGGK
jgi:hypothetical protein